MSSSTAELNLILRAQNLAKSAIGDLQGAVAAVGTKAQTAGAQLSAAFAGKGQILARELGNLTVSLLNGQDFMSAGLMLGSTLAGGLVTAFGEKVIAQITGSALFATIGGALSAAGALIGSIISAAIPIGMAAAPFLLLAAIVAAIAFLVTHPDIAAKVLEIAGNVIKWLVGGLIGLPLALLGAFATAIDGINRFVARRGPRRSPASSCRSRASSSISAARSSRRSSAASRASRARCGRSFTTAFAKLDVNVGPFHITGAGITIDLPNFSQDPRFAGQTYSQAHGLGQHAAGGWAGLHGPELSWLGERGPEYVVANHDLGALGGGPRIIQLIVDGRKLAEVIDRYQESALRRNPAGTG
jgi:hypothetical protein